MVRRIELANEHGVDFPVWDIEEGLLEPGDLDLTAVLVADFRRFAALWHVATPMEVYADRFDGVPVLDALLRARHRLALRLDPSRRPPSEASDESMRTAGRGLAERLQAELGDEVVVIYRHL